MSNQKFSAYARFGDIEAWKDNLVRESILKKMLIQAQDTVEADGFELLEEIDRQIIFEKWNWDWVKIKRWFFFWKRVTHSEDGYYWFCKEEEADRVGVKIIWNTSKPK